MGREISSYGFDPNPRFQGKDTIPRSEEWAASQNKRPSAKDLPGPGPEGPRMKEGSLERSAMMQAAIDNSVRKQLHDSLLGDDVAAGNVKAKVAFERAFNQLSSEILREMSAELASRETRKEKLSADEMREMVRARVDEFLTANQYKRDTLYQVSGENVPFSGEEGSRENPLEMPSAEDEE